MENVNDYNDIDLSKYKIMIFSRSMNFKLFELSASTTTSLPFKHVRLKHTSADGYYYDILKYDIDYAINIDEDAFVTDPDRVLGLLKYCIANKIVNCGFPDGGVLYIRNYNPVVTNAFFNIMDVRAINKKLNYREIDNFDYTQHNYEEKIPKHLFNTHSYEFVDGIEPYYHFMLWLNINFKVFYMDADQYLEGPSTLLKDMNGDIFIAHSWFSRNYGKDPVETKRINELYETFTGKQVREFNQSSDKINKAIDKFSFFYAKNKIYIKKILKKHRLIKYA